MSVLANQTCFENIGDAMTNLSARVAALPAQREAAAVAPQR